MKRVTAARSFQALCLALIASAAGCDPPARVADYLIVPMLEVDKRWAGSGDPLELTYRFDVAPENDAVADDYEVRVDFVDADGETVFSDHHTPPTPTSSWPSGGVIRYRRTVFVPSTATPGPTTIVLSLRAETGRLMAIADASGNGAIVTEVGRLDIDLVSTGVPISYREGWYGTEIDPEDPDVRWQWSAGEALGSFANPRADAVIYLHAAANVSEGGDPAEVSVHTGPGAREAARFRIEQPGPFLRRIYVPAALMGEGDTVELIVRTNAVVVPATGGSSSDDRSLGLRVFNLHVAPQPLWNSYVR